MPVLSRAGDGRLPTRSDYEKGAELATRLALPQLADLASQTVD
ncbi:hypothetical protein SAMCFNEI73_Ch2197 [Sinorhizobium americanum]|uniref:Uncharacterized protein n=1 Tax=Sinorhizobium americanum TaxID=194963 RepID=A0A1L3LN04_9HYPH|nr:hypothetical protein SAMCFNEI73_Ch2197 [Sinorhizobium americanum]